MFLFVIKNMASSNISLIVAILVAAMAFSSMTPTTSAARNLLQIPNMPGIPTLPNMPGVPTLPIPTLPFDPNNPIPTIPGLPSNPLFPKISGSFMPPLPAGLPNIPIISNP
uniref:RNA-binding protein 12-like n=1 Tax=Kalanchoe fedtschenkoi TaxID=63787 RepID=A0A7N0VHI0_KALFE